MSKCVKCNEALSASDILEINEARKNQEFISITCSKCGNKMIFNFEEDKKKAK